MISNVTKQCSGGAGFFCFGRSDELSQMLNIRPGVFVQELSQRIVFADQTVAPLFQQMLPGRVFCRGLIKFSQSGLNRLRVNFSHQLAQVLHLAAPSFTIKTLGIFYTDLKLFWHRDLRQLTGRQIYQALSNRLKGVHLALNLALAGAVFKFFKGVVVHDTIAL